MIRMALFSATGIPPTPKRHSGRESARFSVVLVSQQVRHRTPSANDIHVFTEEEIAKIKDAVINGYRKPFKSRSGNTVMSGLYVPYWLMESSQPSRKSEPRRTTASKAELPDIFTLEELGEFIFLYQAPYFRVLLLHFMTKKLTQI